jgi:hypothetical protein
MNLEEERQVLSATTSSNTVKTRPSSYSKNKSKRPRFERITMKEVVTGGIFHYTT